MNSLEQSLQYFQNYYYGWIDKPSLMTPFEFKLLEKIVQGHAFSKDESERIKKVFEQSSDIFLRDHYALINAFMLRVYELYEKPLVIKDVVSGNQKSLSWVQAFYFVHHHHDVIEQNIHSYHYTRIASVFFAQTDRKLKPETIQNLSKNVHKMSVESLRKFLRQYLLDPHCVLDHKKCDSSHLDIIRSMMHNSPEYMQRLTAELGKNVFHNHFLWTHDSRHPLHYVSYDNHSVWISNLIEYAQNRCRDAWILRRIARTQYNWSVSLLEVPRWKKEWMTAWQGYTSTLNNEQRKVLLFIIQNYNPSHKVKDANRLHQLRIRDPQSLLTDSEMHAFREYIELTKNVLGGDTVDALVANITEHAHPAHLETPLFLDI